MGSQQSSNWREQYDLISSSNPIKKAINKQTKQRHQILTIFPNDEQERQQLQNLIKLRLSKPSPNLVPINSFWSNDQFTPCGGRPQFDLVFRAGVPLQQYLTFRRVKNQKFTKDEIEYVIVKVASGLKQIKDMKEEYGCVNLSNVVIDGDLKLRDPLLAREEQIWHKSKKVHGFPSPQKLYTLFDTPTNFQQYTSDLFSLGILALQLIYPHQNLSTLYKNTNSRYLNCAIDMNQLRAFINGVNEQPLRSYVTTLTNEQPNKRRQIHNLLGQRQIRPEGLKLLKENPYEMVQQDAVIKTESRHYPNPASLRQIKTNSIPLNPVSNVERSQDYKIYLNQPPFLQLKKDNALPLKPLPNRYSQIPSSLALFKSTTTQLWKPNQNVQTSYRNFYDEHSLTPINKIDEDQQSAFKSPKFDLSPLPNISDLPIFSSILSQNSVIPGISQNLNTGGTIPSLNQNNFIFKSEVPIQKHSPLYADSAHRSTFLAYSNPQIPSSIALHQNTQVHSSLLLHDYQPQQKKLIQINKIVLQPLPQIKANIQQVLEQVRTSIDDHQAQKKSIIQKINNELELEKVTIIQTLNEPQNEIKKQLRQFSQPVRQTKKQTQKQVQQQKQKDGFIIEQYDIGTRYQGYKKNGMRNGQGQFIYKQGSKYKGQWKDNKMEGYGVLYYPNGSVAYEGQWHDDQFDGLGTVYNDHPTPLKGAFDYTNFNLLDEEWIKYEGNLKKDAKQGLGKLYLTNGEIYSGQFQNDLVHGEGEFKRNNGSIIRGLWSEGLLKKLIYQ